MKIISVVTPSFNQGQFIEETIQSILDQEGPFYIDYIIMDGGSSDETVNHILRIEKELRRHCESITEYGLSFFTDSSKKRIKCLGLSYRWYSEDDRGQVHALKKGFNLAVGNLFYWLNSDDILVDSTVFSRVFEYFEKDHALQLLTGDGPFISKEGNFLGLHHVDRLNFKELLFLDYHILQPSTFFRSEIYDERYLDEGYVCAFDADFFIHLLHDKRAFLKVEDQFGAFRFYEETKTMGLAKKRYKEQKKISLRYSKNYFYYVVSSFYRYLAIVKNWKHTPSPRKQKIFQFIYKLSYRIITGKSGR